jgi:hypothetical protein
MIFAPQLPRAGGQRLGDAGRVDMAVIGRVQRADDAVEIVERMQLPDTRSGPTSSMLKPSARPTDSVWRSQSISSSV